MSGIGIVKRFSKQQRDKHRDKQQAKQKKKQKEKHIRGAFYLCVVFIVVFIFAVGVAGVSSGCSEDKKSTGYEKAWEIVKKEILKDNPGDKIIYVSGKLLPPGHEIKSWGTSHNVPGDFSNAWFFFIDEQPTANWGHKCKYVFVDSQTGNYSIVESTNPPDSMDEMKKIYPTSSS